MTDTVPTGPYFGFTYAELQQELIRYKAEVRTSGTRLVGATVNGQNFQFGNREGSIAEWQTDLQAAMAYLRPDLHDAPPTDRSAVRFV